MSEDSTRTRVSRTTQVSVTSVTSHHLPKANAILSGRMMTVASSRTDAEGNTWAETKR